ncbi:hypothetical protein Nepgr_004511 [Nepenthes gracilis]|uniref:Uncharacterized protein n=1 Tax=Nepenthes gracilis TaxID=150966 RepID=A0AAD3S1I1_NEPGR|nr:hypothetical protein Nepgr_004511 [Nepenthes gracilis]
MDPGGERNHVALTKHGLAKVLLFIYGTPYNYTTSLQGLSAWTSTNNPPGCLPRVGANQSMRRNPGPSRSSPSGQQQLLVTGCKGFQRTLDSCHNVRKWIRGFLR